MSGHYYSSPYTNEGEKVPSVTTILQICNKEYLKPWVAKVEREMVLDKWWEAHQGLQHIDSRAWLDEYIKPFAQAYKRVGQEAMSLGSLVHNFVECFYKVWDEESDEIWSSEEKYMSFLSDYYPVDSIKMLSSFFKCLSTQNITIIASEREVHHPLGFAGTLDLIGRVNGVLSVLDIKTGEPQKTTNNKGRIPYNALPMEYTMQVEAYRRCPDAWDVQPSGRGVIYLSKKKPGTYYFWHEDFNNNNEIDWDAFINGAFKLWKRSKKK